MIDYLSTYRTQDKMYGKHYVPVGALFWFECNQYGDLLGSCYFIKTVPDQDLMNESYLGAGYRKLMHKQKEILTMTQVLNKAERFMKHIDVIKPRLTQKG